MALIFICLVLFSDRTNSFLDRPTTSVGQHNCSQDLNAISELAANSAVCPA